MFYGDSTQDTRSLFFTSWRKHQKKEALMPLEAQIVEVIIAHPEYHRFLESDPKQTDTRFFPELGDTNPFLHMGLHLAIRDQIAMDRPKGSQDIYQRLSKKHPNALDAEHLLMEVLAECMWQAQQHQSMIDEHEYIQRCYQLLLA